MKLAVTILASILFACSVTTAIPVNPSATTSAEASTSTVTPSAQTTPSIDLSRLSDEDMNLIKEYAKMKKSRDNAKETYDLLQPKALAQKKLLDWLDEEYEQLLRKFQTSEGHSKHSEKLNELEQKLKQERKTLDELEIKQHSSGFLNLNWILGKIKSQLLECLFKGNMNQPFEYYTIFLESDPKFLELVSTFGNSTPSQQPGSEQPSTSGTQNQSKHHKSSSSSSKTSTVSVQPIQTSSSTQAALSSTQRTSRSNSRLFGLWGSPKSSRVYDTPKSKNELKSFLDSPNPNDSDESDDESSV
ncbi:hypothetical protein QVD99_002043 [Batrachochytrium dendrobatidis]|nr:hypothetical protein QVD99_006851 [Batrachochytrium dendrobatidis]KAK5670186.1 hypothetical protein QVD99_003333 [Batrachochytrium dendrobatidis]KAK5671165.1 hypothetical protein QVD99_002926 [Batrachochytrium dendrobatidis]KAK5672244.1 hypothetical protein QVD99_002043 [Batrachochytrium dendrobatidis]